MSYLLNISDVLDVAIVIEKSGYQFYVEAMKKFSDSKIVELFQYLADEEFKHQNLFTQLKKNWVSKGNESNFDPEYQAYVSAFCRSHSLVDPERFQKKISVLNTFEDAVEAAIGFEKDSVVFFSELKEILGKDRSQTVELIIGEEMKHIRRIVEFRMQTGL